MRLGAAAGTVRDGFCRDACLHGIPTGALASYQDEQRNRAHQPRDQEEDEGRRDLPGRQLGPHVGDGEAEVLSGARGGTWTCPNWRRWTG